MKRAALVTGASSGFGLLTAVELARTGHHVFATVRDPAKAGPLLEAAACLGVEVTVLPLDVRRPESVAACVAEVLRRAGQLDVLVNNAGIAIGGFFEDQSAEEIREQFETNVFGAMEVTRAVLPSMRAARSGKVIIVSSFGGRLGTPGLGPYCATKFALEGFAEALRHEVRSFGVQAALVEPGTYGTEAFFANKRVARGAGRRADYAGRLEAAQAALYTDLERRRPDPGEVARAIGRLAAARRLPLRTTVGRDARLGALAQWLLPAWLFERMVARMFAPPPPPAPMDLHAGAAKAVE